MSDPQDKPPTYSELPAHERKGRSTLLWVVLALIVIVLVLWWALGRQDGISVSSPPPTQNVPGLVPARPSPAQ
ncbi:hypothetical protein [Jiella sp. M17.18]|uniref:hypothetical protein n=1 Tax=Jiella sp. M17.18 TaxID=3234247 RepID=UPI0034DDEB55